MRFSRFAVFVLAVTIPVIVSMLVSLSFASLRTRDRGPAYFEEGRRIFFEVGCARCHSIDGSGQRRIGPPLHEIGRVGAVRKPGMTAAEYILESIIDPGAFRAPGVTGGMPAGLLYGKGALRQVVGFLASRGATLRVEEIEQLNIPDVPKGTSSEKEFDLSKVKQGEAIFRGKGECTTCHPLRPDPALNLLAPSLLNVGVLNASDLRQSIVDPNAKISLGYEQVVARKRDGSTVSGRFVEKTDDGIYVLEKRPGGDLATVFVPFSEMQPSEDDGAPDYWVSKASLMPIVKDALTAEEIDALVAFLKNRHGNR